MRISRSFTVHGRRLRRLRCREGTDARKAAEERAAAEDVGAQARRSRFPTSGTASCNTSSVIIAQRIDPLPAPLTPQQQADRPYALGSMEIVPAFETKFTKKSELSTFMLIYNPKVDTREQSRTSPSNTTSTRQPLGSAGEVLQQDRRRRTSTRRRCRRNFDLAAGHQLQSGQAVPLASFPEGQYRLEIKVTDKIANKTLVREGRNFTVSPS